MMELKEHLGELDKDLSTLILKISDLAEPIERSRKGKETWSLFSGHFGAYTISV